MCGRFVAATDAEGLTRFFVVDERQHDDLPPSWNRAPTDPTYAVVQHDGKRVLVSYRWGLVPFWADGPKIGSRMINARADSVRTKRAFADSFERRRCLIPADGFYEWRRQGEVKPVPFFVQRADGAPMAFAGLWASWRDRNDPEGPPLRTCTIITTDANDAVAPIHDRMPVVLDRSDWERWLDREADLDDVEALLRPLAASAVTLRRVSQAVNNVRSNGPQLLEAVGDDAPLGLPGLARTDERTA